MLPVVQVCVLLPHRKLCVSMLCMSLVTGMQFSIGALTVPMALQIPPAAGTQQVPISQGVGSCVMSLFPWHPRFHSISSACPRCAGRGLSCCTMVGSSLKMLPSEKTIILAHPALPEPSLHWEMCSKVTLFFLQLPLLGHWSCAEGRVLFGLLEAVLFGVVVVCRELRKLWVPQGGNTKRTPRGY